MAECSAVQVLVLAGSLLVAAFLALLQAPGRASSGLLPWLVAGWAALLPLAALLQVRSTLKGCY